MDEDTRTAGDPEVLVSLDNVTKHFSSRGGLRGRGPVVRAVEGVSLDVVRGETLAVVGETGCGKSTLARLILRLLPLTGGTVTIEGVDITHAGRRKLRPLRRDMQLIFQDSFSSLNPRHRIGVIIAESLRIHRIVPKQDRRARTERLMQLVGLSAEHYDRYPRDFSGGQRQRVNIARAVAVQPKLLVCDEPVSALDVSIQAQILNLLLDLRSEFGLTYIFISHDLAVVRYIADRVAVMYLGRVVELGPATAMFAAPRHPYTAALLSATPEPDLDAARSVRRVVLQGDPPSPTNPPRGCAFHPRCPRAEAMCSTDLPSLADDGRGNFVACHFPLRPGEALESKSAVNTTIRTPQGGNE